MRAARPGGPRKIDSILDVGCGDGRTAIEVAAAVGARRAVGLDHDAEALAVARARGLAVVEAFAADVPRLFPRRFDLVHAYGLAEAIPTLGALLWAMLSAARPGGLVLASYALPTAATNVWLRAARAGGLEVRFHAAEASEVEALVERLPIPARLVAQAPIWRFYSTSERVLRSRAPGIVWDAVDLAARVAGRPPAAVYALIERRA